VSTHWPSTRVDEVVGIFCHDTGGAEFLARWASSYRGDLFYCIEGPAKTVFTSILGKVRFSTFEDTVKASGLFLCGTSWQSDLEKYATREARRLKKRSITYIDHWGNYRERFILRNSLVLPDEIWVSNIQSLKICKDLFDTANTFIVEDLVRLDSIRQSLTLKDKVKRVNGRVLYIAENLSEHYSRRTGNSKFLGYDEYDALDYFFEKLDLIYPKVNSIVIRRHPSETFLKYKPYTKRRADTALSGPEVPLLHDLLKAEMVVGLQSQALVTACDVGARVISCIPPGGKPCCLPEEKIIHFDETTWVGS
jgi:hypothetical protein